MRLYELTLHFPDCYGSLDHQEMTLTNLEYFYTAEDAVKRAKTIAHSFVSPQPDFWYLEDGGTTIYTETPEKVKEAIHYYILKEKPTIIEV